MQDKHATFITKTYQGLCYKCCELLLSTKTLNLSIFVKHTQICQAFINFDVAASLKLMVERER